MVAALKSKSTIAENVKDNWATPQSVVDAVEQHLCVRFLIDVCATSSTKKCPEYYGPELGIDGLSAEWGAFNWCNPPFSQKAEWLAKAVIEAKERGCITAYLFAHDLGTRFCADVEAASSIILAPRNRINFLDENGKHRKSISKKTGKLVTSGPLFSSAIALITPWAKPEFVEHRRIEI